MKQIGTAELVYVRLDKCPRCGAGTLEDQRPQCRQCGFSLVAIEYSYAVYRLLALTGSEGVIKDKAEFNARCTDLVATIAVATTVADLPAVAQAEIAAGLNGIERIIYEGKIYLPTGTRK